MSKTVASLSPVGVHRGFIKSWVVSQERDGEIVESNLLLKRTNS